ncbi:unnamed protein product [Effrenium voratum]|uniref:Uncharacterized protein n=1 Tax=Effrenium voratum TaxID=2562239 RepID=A0AA36I655_9DINO|nr:unnamed protein product [Effrenium voratum]CAJ1420559.1 unnamed protein product [Effrenium voratum]
MAGRALAAMAAMAMASAGEEFPGRYVIKNVRTSRRLVSSSWGFFADARGPITEEHLWRLQAEGNNSHSIVNAATGGRVLAQSDMDMDQGFFAVAAGPTYQDQKWQLQLQSDGSYIIANAKNGRRLWTGPESLPVSFGAAAGATTAFEPEGARWWLIDQDRDRAALLALQLRSEAQSRRSLAARLEEQEARVNQLAELSRPLCDACDEPWDWQRSLLLAVLLLAAFNWHLRRQLRRAQVPAKDAPDSSSPGLGTDFGHQVVDTLTQEKHLRLIKVQCPGVEHGDVEVELLFNGCHVRIERRASCGVPAASWMRRFEFSPQDGLFEFREDQMRLEQGFLHLIFQHRSFQARRIRFPQHYALSATDTDLWWEYPEAKPAQDPSQ